MAIKTVVFDFGNVLGFFDHGIALRQLAKLADLPPATIRQRLFTDELEELYESGRISTSEVLALARERCGFRCSDDEFELAFADMFWPNEDLCRLVPRLKADYRLLLLSNTTDMHARQFRRQFAETLRHFDALILSHEVNFRKPQPDIYRHCLAYAGCEPAECVFIDDLPANVAAAKACGWQGLVYRDYETLCNELVMLSVSI
jgi:putative hydrolase of the HAD superfamily